MKIIKIILYITPVFLIASCSSPLVNNSLWRSTPLIVDGKANEWSIPLDYYDPKTKLNFSIANDMHNLYFCVRATEDETEKGIMNSGLQICLDTAGGKKTELEVDYPVMGKQMKITGFRGTIDGLTNAKNMYGINASAGYDSSHIMILEVCIPFKSFYKPALSSSDSAKVLGVTFKFTVGPHAHGNKSGNSGGGGGGRHGGSGGMGGMHGGGGGMHGGGGGSNSNSDEGSSSPQTLSAYAKFRLATGKL